MTAADPEMPTEPTEDAELRLWIELEPRPFTRLVGVLLVAGGAR
jgi:hypothetical protein